MAGRYGVERLAWIGRAIARGERSRRSAADAPRVGLGEVMDLWFELRKRGRDVVWPVLAVCTLAYLAYHIVHGDRGLVAWREVRDAVVQAKRDLAVVEAERAVLAHGVRLLHPASIDPDMLEEWARRQLGYGRPDDIVILTKGSGQEGQRRRASVASASLDR
jgi:cell division protein FtsB